MSRREPRWEFGRHLRSLKWWRRAEDDVRQEIDLHVDLRRRDLEAHGATPDDALAQARREAGTPDRVAAEVTRLAHSGDRASALRQWLDECAQDVRYAIRAGRRAPAATLLTLATIALALGANAAIFGVVNVTVLAPLPFDPDGTLVRVREFRTTPDGAVQHVDASRRTADAVAGRPDLFASSAIVSGLGRTLARDDGALRVAGMRVGPGFTRVVGVPPVRGRTFTTDEERAGDAASAVLVSHEFWQGVLGGADSALGETIVLDGRGHQVIGVLPPNFHVPYSADLWFPSTFDPDARSIFILARLADGVSLEQAQAALGPVGEELNRLYPTVMGGLGVTAVRARDYFVDDDDQVVLALMGAVGLLLLIGCTNVALLLTTRFASRQSEVTVRAALGCSRARQIRQFVVEGVLVFLAGGAAGLLVAVWVKDSLVVLLPGPLATQVGFDGIPIDARLLMFSAAMSVGAGVVFGLLAALRAPRPDASATTRSVAGRASRGTLGGLVVAETALAVVLLTGAGIMVHAFARLASQDLGFNPSGVLTARLDLTADQYASDEARRLLMDRLLETLRDRPDVASAAATTVNPLCCGDWGIRMTPEGLAPATPDEMPIAQHFIVTPGYFDAVDQPVLEGRAFDARDVPGSEAVAIVNREFADRFWPGESAIGKRVKRGMADAEYPWMTVVGVVSRVHGNGEYGIGWYLPHAQHATGPSADGAHLMIRGAAGVAPPLEAIRREVAGIDTRLALYEARTMDAIRAENIAQDRVGAWTATLLAAAGLLLAGVGLYGVLAFVVAGDRREIAVRLALGASRRSVLRLVLGRGLRLTATGLLAGSVVAWVASVTASSWLTIVEPDARIIALAAGVLLIAALLATAGPALRALRIDAVSVLRSE